MKYCPLYNGLCRNDCMMKLTNEMCALRQMAVALSNASKAEKPQCDKKVRGKKNENSEEPAN